MSLATARRAKIRDDLIRRLFAVAISVGFAATFLKFQWVQDRSWPPSRGDYDTIAVLVTGLAATVFSWDGYLMSISRKPLFGFWRFAIDIVLVFTYMIFMILAPQHTVWFPLWATPSLFLQGSAAAGGIALINAIGNIGGFLGPYLVGWLKDATQNYALAMAALGFSLASAAFIMTVVGKALASQTARSISRNA